MRLCLACHCCDTPLEEDGDIDLWIVAENDEKAKTVYNQVVRHLSVISDSQNHKQLLLTRSPKAVTIPLGYPHRNVQVIRRQYSCIAEVIFNFDIDCCQVAWDGNRVVATLSAFRALQTGVNIADPERSGRDYEDRLLKYVKRGFMVAVLGIMTSRIKCKYSGNNEFFTFVRGKKPRHVILDFSQTRSDGKAGPVCTIQKEDIQGLAKLLVLSTLHDGKNRLIRAGKLLACGADWNYNDFLLDPTPPVFLLP